MRGHHAPRMNPLFHALRLLCLAVLGLLFPWTGGRHIRLSQDPPGRVRFLSQAITLAEDAAQTWVTLTRTGNFTDPRYGSFSITPAMLEQMVRNFDARVLGQDVFIDVNHEPSNGAAAKVVKLTVHDGRLRALVEWTPFGFDAIRTRGFTYLSAEYHEKWRDNEAQQMHGCVLLGAGLTLRPVISRLDPVQLSNPDPDPDAVPTRTAISAQLLRELSQPEPSMNHLETLRAKLLALGLPEAAVVKLLAQAKTQFDAAGADQAKCLSIVTAWEETGKVLHEATRANPGAPLNITLSAPANPVDVAAEVARVLAQQTQAHNDAATALAGKLKLLSDTIAAGDTTLTPEGVTALSADYVPMVTAATTDDQVKHLASLAVAQAKKLSAAQRLATLGYAPPSGSLHIVVDASTQINGLQAALDKRLSLERTDGDTRRFFATGGKLLSANKDFAERALAQFDAAHGAQLHEEHKLLSGGIGTVADIRVPAAVERTVLREQLYNLVSLNLMDTGTVAPAPTYMIPYSYRDTSAAGVGNTRVYERQGIQRAGVIQTWDTAYNTPQKLSFQVSNELRMLMGASVIDFEPIAENVRNIVRIVGEDTEAININEIVRSADEYQVATKSDTLTAQVNGTNRIFVLTEFPVVRPRAYFDLQGAQVGSTINPVTVTLNAVARSEYVRPVDGSALAAGLYWIMDWNQGEIRFVNEAGVLQAPTSAWVLSIQYSYTTNVARFNLDLGSLTVGQKYDDLLTAIGSRKVVIEDDRYYTAGLVLMTGAVNNALGQATTFTANGSRTGTSLNADGSVGVTKGVNTFKPSAPGMMLNDNRIVVGEMRNSRFRLAKSFAMGDLQEARNTNGLFIGAREGYGEQFIVSHTPVNRKGAATSIALYSGTGRVARAA